jgi:hypothetical protein
VFAHNNEEQHLRKLTLDHVLNVLEPISRQAKKVFRDGEAFAKLQKVNASSIAMPMSGRSKSFISETKACRRKVESESERSASARQGSDVAALACTTLLLYSRLW